LPETLDISRTIFISILNAAHSLNTLLIGPSSYKGRKLVKDQFRPREKIIDKL
jgi:hypothetical protein